MAIGSREVAATVRHVAENVGAADIELSDDDLRELDRVAPVGASSGSAIPRRV